jgi:hypothetical protein
MTHVFSPRQAWELHLRSSVIAGGVAREPWIDGEGRRNGRFTYYCFESVLRYVIYLSYSIYYIQQFLSPSARLYINDNHTLSSPDSARENVKASEQSHYPERAY